MTIANDADDIPPGGDLTPFRASFPDGAQRLYGSAKAGQKQTAEKQEMNHQRRNHLSRSNFYRTPVHSLR